MVTRVTSYLLQRSRGERQRSPPLHQVPHTISETATETVPATLGETGTIETEMAVADAGRNSRAIEDFSECGYVLMGHTEIDIE